MHGSQGSFEQARNELTARLQSRRPEIEQVALTRVYSVSDPSEALDPEYVEGLRAAVSAAIDYGLVAVERGDERPPPVPAALLAQARLAARNGVSLDTVLRRCFAGYTLLGDFVIHEAGDGDLLQGSTLQRVMRAQANAFDRLVAAVTDEYSRERQGRLDSAEQRRTERVQRLLAGELLDTAELDYGFEVNHLGVIAVGAGAAEALRALAAALDRRLLLIRRSEEAVWAWLGARRRADPAELERLVSASWPTQLSLAIGEPAEGLAGWRLTHRQARAALPVAQRSTGRTARYADVALLASVLQDDVLAASLRRLYLAPLGDERDGGATARETLRAYFAAGRNISSAAAALAVHRDTVANRLRAIEARIGRPPDACAADLELALRLDELAEPTT